MLNRWPELGEDANYPVEMSADSAILVAGSDVTSTESHDHFTKLDAVSQPGSTSDVTMHEDVVSDVTERSGMDGLEWNNGVGVLPGSDIKFQINAEGDLEMISEKLDGFSGAVGQSFTAAPENGDVSASMEEPMKGTDFALGSHDIPGVPRTPPDQGLALTPSNPRAALAKSNPEPPMIPSKPVVAQIPSNPGPPMVTSDPGPPMVTSDLSHINPRFSRTCVFCGRLGDSRKFCGNFCSKGCIARNAGKHKRFLRNNGVKVKYTRRVGVHRNVRGVRGSRSQDPADLKIKIRLPSTSGTPRRKPSIVNDDADFGKRRYGNAFSGRMNRRRFSWEEHLKSGDVIAAPSELFINPFPTRGNLFEVGQLLEAVDPEHESMVCLVTVASICGHRIRLHFEGYPSVFNFWVSTDSPKIFPCGFCEKTGRSLAPPRSYDPSEFDWKEYAKERKLSAAPDHAFVSLSFENKTKFKVDDKLEAVDRKHPDLTCVATVIDIISDYVLIHFDGWNSDYDYWAHATSNYLRPIGWCHDNNKILSPPLNFTGAFDWGVYLGENNAADCDAFVCKPHGFQTGMGVEVVDPRNSILLRVASIVDIDEYRVKIHFDGWSDMYDVWMDADSPDIHPPMWGQITQHPLQPPITIEELARDDSGCPIPGCNGAGHVQHDKYVTHHSEFGCPYSPQNLGRDPPPDRLSFHTETRSDAVENFDHTNEPRRRGYYRGRKRGRGRALSNQMSVRRVSREIPEARSVDPKYRLRHPRLPSFNDSPIYRAAVFLHQNKKDNEVPDLWHQHVKHLPGVMGTRASDVRSWSINRVAEFVQRVTGKDDYGEVFASQEIDGEALLMLTQADMSSLLKLKLGPSVKIFNAIVMFKLADRIKI